MNDNKLARTLLKSAAIDLVELEETQNNPRTADEAFGFHVQQAVEKGFKAWCCTLGFAIP